ncbi:primosomal protein N' [Jeotgalibacillus haloalkalitolerans]|uniref:Replication restart protein PriA n=1 Tax=Jeotgalibacillus haloalkalitolerans TaxID=3104292 RepID=A0ABU5KKB0_9BACL|nr:primosomal protein N' [Jeotgalibacillus sp. HH7-29]MDZ5711602.1 primosomal protein N' [Jeotgalibacillus sp. HH7-29]
MIASVIVDVPAKQIDRTFDYQVPENLQSVVQRGIRVVVPFGPRKIQGFILGIKEESSVKKLKLIEEVVDIEPVLNEELMSLSEWLTEQTLCYRISALQVMLPAAMKAKYNKFFHLLEDVDIPSHIRELFQKESPLTWKTADEQHALKDLQELIKQRKVEVKYVVRQSGNVKKKRFVEINGQLTVDDIPANAKKQKLIMEHLNRHDGKMSVAELKEAAGTTSAVIKTMIDNGYLKEFFSEQYRDPFAERTFEKTEHFTLTPDQKNAITPILEKVNQYEQQTFLLHGVTGSGKTEIYLQTIDQVLKQNRQAIMLVPEISLTPQMVQRFKGRFGNQVAVMHSGLSVGEKYDEWRKIHRGEVNVVVGARSAIFAPFKKLGVIIIDEEHETSYKQEDSPRYHARDVAIERSNRHGCPVILGSATPSLESFARAKKGNYQLLELEYRMNQQDLPEVRVIDMREELREGNRSMFSRDLLTEIEKRIEKKEQVVLFLNRRGYSSFIMCRDCGTVMQCPHCEVSLTYHRSKESMKCHYCGHEEYVPNTCPECESEHIRYFGTGTQKVEEELFKLMPHVKTIRMDVDTTSKKGSHEKLLDVFGRGEADILLGTQMIAKGLDFPNITLVGVLSADTMLHLPDFRASEKTFQLLTQVSGRAGRHEKPGEVIIQTYTPEHFSIELAKSQNYEWFYQKEMMMRKAAQYPPFYYLSLITLSHENVNKAAGVCNEIADILKSRLSDQSIILGPVASPIARIQDKYRYQCIIKYKREPELKNLLKKILDQYSDTGKDAVTIHIDVQPYIMM